MVHNPAEAYEKGYADGLSTAEKMRWQGTPIGDLLRRFPHRPEQQYRAAYEEGFAQAMTAASRVEWLFTREARRKSSGLFFCESEATAKKNVVAHDSKNSELDNEQ